MLNEFDFQATLLSFQKKMTDFLSIIRKTSGIAQSPIGSKHPVCERVTSYTAVIYKNNLSGRQEYTAQPWSYHALIWDTLKLIHEVPMAVRNTEEKYSRINTAYDCKQIFPGRNEKSIAHIARKHSFIVRFLLFPIDDEQRTARRLNRPPAISGGAARFFEWSISNQHRGAFFFQRGHRNIVCAKNGHGGLFNAKHLAQLLQTLQIA